MSDMPIVIVESPFAGKAPKGTPADQIEEAILRERSINIKYMQAALRDCLLKGEAPYASHALYTQAGVLNDDIAEERELGIHAGFAFRKHAVRTVVYTDRGISTDMRYGIDHSISLGVPLAFRVIQAVTGAPASIYQWDDQGFYFLDENWRARPERYGTFKELEAALSAHGEAM